MKIKNMSKEKPMLPTAKTPSKMDIHSLTTLIYGPSKIGKSTWCSHAENALFLATEPGLNALEVYQVPIFSWQDLLKTAQKISTEEHPFETIVIDTIDNAYKMCRDHICAKFKISHPSDLPFGKGFSLINEEFQRVLNKLALLPSGLILVSHSFERDFEAKTGAYTRTIPTLPESARKLVVALVDLILFCDLQRDEDGSQNGKEVYQRVIRTKPSLTYDAGDRTGKLPDTLPLDFDAFLEAFNTGDTEDYELR
jgi:hypothetical protein